MDLCPDIGTHVATDDRLFAFSAKGCAVPFCRFARRDFGHQRCVSVQPHMVSSRHSLVRDLAGLPVMGVASAAGDECVYGFRTAFT